MEPSVTDGIIITLLLVGIVGLFLGIAIELFDKIADAINYDADDQD